MPCMLSSRLSKKQEKGAFGEDVRARELRAAAVTDLVNNKLAAMLSRAPLSYGRSLSAQYLGIRICTYLCFKTLMFVAHYRGPCILHRCVKVKCTTSTTLPGRDAATNRAGTCFAMVSLFVCVGCVV